MSNSKFTVGDLLRHLQYLNPEDELEFAGGLTFSRIKRFGDALHVLDFGEIQADLSEAFRKKNPHIQVAFVRNEGFAEGEAARTIYVSVL